jgi:transcriptional regulator with XRE-family HTH domain
MRKNLRAVRLQLGRNVQQLRRGRGWSQERLAEAAGHSLQVIGRVERGEANVSVDILIAIAAGLSIPVADLFTLTRDPGGPHCVLVLSRQEAAGLERLAARVRSANRRPRGPSRPARR